MSISKQAVLLFCLLFLCYGYVHEHMGANQNSRLDLLHAIFLQKSFSIDAYHENTVDKSIHNGHYYSDKAPGIVFLALPAFAISMAILYVLDVPLDSPEGWLVSDWITTVGSVGVITALGGVAMFIFLCRLVEQRFAFLTTYVVFLGAAPFPYATMLFSHAAVIGLICIALWAISDEFFVSRKIGRVSDAQSSGKSPTHDLDNLSSAAGGGRGEWGMPWIQRYLLAGLCCGLAISSEYTAATAAGGVLLLAFLTSFKRGIVLALGAFLPLLLIPINNWACFGSPLAFGYHHLALTKFQEMNKGLFGVTFPPKASAAYLILFSPARGLFFWTPFFLMAFVGLRSLLANSRSLFWISCAVIVLHVVFISGYYMPGGGEALGPRLLAPMIPFAAIGAAYGLRARPLLGSVLGYCSIVLTGIATLIDATPPENAANPLLSFYLSGLVDYETNIGSNPGVSPILKNFPILLLISVSYLIASRWMVISRRSMPCR